MKKIKFDEENILTLKEKLKSLYIERLKLLIEKSNGTQFKKKHEIKKIKIDIARILTYMNKVKREKNES